MTTWKQCHLCYIKKNWKTKRCNALYTQANLKTLQNWEFPRHSGSNSFRLVLIDNVAVKGSMAYLIENRKFFKLFTIAVEEYFISKNCQANSALQTQSSILITVIIVWFLKHQGLENMCMKGMSSWMEIFHRNFGLTSMLCFPWKSILIFVFRRFFSVFLVHTHEFKFISFIQLLNKDFSGFLFLRASTEFTAKRSLHEALACSTGPKFTMAAILISELLHESWQRISQTLQNEL